MTNPIEAIKRALFRPFKKRFDRIIKELAAIREDIAKLDDAMEGLSQALLENRAMVEDANRSLSESIGKSQVETRALADELGKSLAENRARTDGIVSELETLKMHITCIDDSMKSIEVIVASECTPEMVEAGVLPADAKTS